MGKRWPLVCSYQHTMGGPLCPPQSTRVLSFLRQGQGIEEQEGENGSLSAQRTASELGNLKLEPSVIESFRELAPLS